MTKAKVVFCLAALAFSSAAAAIPARDVSPDPSSINVFFSESFAFDHERLTVFTGRGGLRTSENRGDEWHRAMNGYLDGRGR